MQATQATEADLTALREMIREWGLKEVRPHVVERERSGEFPADLYRQMGGLGFFGACFPEELGGTAAGLRALAEISEQLAWVYPPLSAAMNTQAATVPLTISNWGASEVAERFVPGLIAGELLGCNAMTEPDGGSDLLGAMRTRAVRDGSDYVISGSKMWITNANVADVAIVYAKTDPEAGHRGVSGFVVPTDSPGFTTQRIPCRGLGNFMPTNMVFLDEVRVPSSHLLGEEGQGFTVAMNAMDFGRLTVSARSVGLSQACLDYAADHARSREAFGQPIGSFQMVQKQLADMAVEVHAARLMVQDAARDADAGLGTTRKTTYAKYLGGEICNRAAQAAADIFGGLAFSDELPIGLFLNYAKLYQTGEGSANIQASLIAQDLLGTKSMDRHNTVPRKTTKTDEGVQDA